MLADLFVVLLGRAVGVKGKQRGEVMVGGSQGTGFAFDCFSYFH
jgi:hypothetical protein